MIKTKFHIDFISLPRLVIFLLLGLSFATCKNGQKVNEQNIYTQRKAFKLIFHEANSEKMIGHNEKAIELFEKCLIYEANNSAVHFALSDLYESLEDKKKMLHHAEQAYQFNNKNKWYALRLADIYFAKEEYQKTADLYEGVIAEEKNIDLKFKYTEALIRSSRNERAIEMLNEIEVETGKTPEVSFTKYELFNKLGRFEAAEKEIQDFINDNPNDLDNQTMAAEFYMQNNQIGKAIVIMQSVIEKDPSYGQAYIMMADLELRQDHVDEAFFNLLKGFKSADVELDRKLEILRGLVPYAAKNQNDFETMRKGIDSLFDIIYDPALKNSKLHDYFGYFLVTCEKDQEAEKEYLIASGLNKASYNIWLQLLNLEKELEQYDKLFENGKKASELFPAQPVFHLFTGIGAKEKGQFDDAEEWFFLGKDLVVQDPQLSSEFLFQIGDMNFKNGEKAESNFYFDQAIEAFAGNVNVYEHRAKQLIDENNLTEAETEIKKGLILVPKNVRLLTLQGDILFLKKEYKNSGEIYLKALYEFYYNQKVLEKYGDALFLQGDKEKALALWNDALKYGNVSPLLLKKIEDETYYPPK
ncbi:hypothetical protein N8987_01095 [Crocinitomix sp.]|nr:hypothetical protein [Crocinitomix sp.]